MLAPISWLKDYVNINCSPEQLAKKMVSIGFEIDGITYQERQATSVVVGKIVKVEKHPNADRLRVTQIDIGTKTIQVVTNVAVEGGETIAVALDGAHLADGHDIKRGELRGVLSEGMLCGLEEVGLSEDDVENQKLGDIIRFEEGTALGQNALKALGYDDVIMDVDVTANRPDCNSIYKLAKEVAVALKTDCCEPKIHYEISANAGNVNDVVSVEVLNDKLCPRYMAAGVKNIRIFPSSSLIKHRLKAVGIRPINNIVDITNYVLIEIGQPMHAFDERELEGDKIIVRNAKENEHIVSLDGKDNALTDKMLVICDAIKPVAVAGIMGGEQSGIKADTATVVFESAKFARDNVRRTSKALNLRSDSSSRFEKGIDFASQEYGIKRALTLVYESGSGDICDGFIDVKVDYPKSRDIEFTVKKLKEILGCNVPKNTLVAILNRLGIAVSDNGRSLTAHIKEDREDIVGVNDIAEEFIRVYGYSHVKPTLFEYAPLTEGGKPAKMKFVDKVKDVLCTLGMSEGSSYSFTSPKFADKLNLAQDASERNTIKLLNPLGEELSVMRTMLVHSMLEALSFNLTHFNKEAKLFEVAKVYLPKELPLVELPHEEEKLCIGMFGNDTDFFELKRVLDGLFYALGCDAKYAKVMVPYLHPGRSAEMSVDGESIGVMGEVHPDVAARYGADEIRLYVAELSMDKLFEKVGGAIKFKAFSRFPLVERDLAVVVNRNVVAGDMIDAVKKSKPAYLDTAKIFDVYVGDQVGKNKKSVAMNFTFTSVERTLKDDEIQAEMDKILNLLHRKFGAKIR